MLDAQTIAIVKSTAPVIAELGPELTRNFYTKMLTAHPELKNVFNASNQRSGTQSVALFNAVLAYAQNIDNLSVLLPAVELIAQKHASLLIRADQYPIVGKYLLMAIEELLNPGAEVINAWQQAYGVLADIFISRESAIYQASADERGGWRGVRPFRIADINRQSDIITSFELEPTDELPVADYQAGQYLGLFIKPDGFTYRQARQYSLTRRGGAGNGYRIAVKREDKGVVSNWLHQQARVGDVVELAPPHGEFILQADSATPVTLISAGVGVTPMLAMLDELVHRQHPAQVNWLHAAKSERSAAFHADAMALGGQLPRFASWQWFSQPDSSVEEQSRGHINLAAIEGALSAPDMTFYLCGPQGFMQDIAAQLTRLGVTGSRVRYECFGPLQGL